MGRELLAYEDLFDRSDFRPRMRFLTDYLLAKARFLEVQACRMRSEGARKLLLDAFWNFDYSFGEGNVFRPALLRLAKDEAFKGSATCSELLSRLKIGDSPPEEELITAVEALDKKWWMEEIEG
jgi:hypothetical protein